MDLQKHAFVYFVGFVICGFGIASFFDRISLSFIFIGAGFIIWSGIQIYFEKKFY